MRRREPDPDAILRGASLTLQRNCVAFGLNRRDCTLQVRVDESAVREIALTYFPSDGGAPFSQRRWLRAFLEGGTETMSDVKSVVGEMVWNVALAFRPPRPAPPSGWSVHPAAASIMAAAGTLLPNPADPLNWLLHSNAELHLPGGGSIAGAVFGAREGVLLLKRASVVSGRGVVVATMGMDGPTPLVMLPGEYPETLVGSLDGRAAADICEVFAADPRGATAAIKNAHNERGYQPATVIRLADRLVPLLPTDKGGER